MPDDSNEPTTCTVTLEDGVLLCECRKDAQIDLDEAKRISARLRVVGENRARPLVVDLGSMKSLTKDARDFFAHDRGNAETYTAVALVANNPLTNLLGNFFLGINKPVHPARLFGSRQKALDWLQQYKEA